MNTAALYRDRTPRLISPGSRWMIFLAVVAVHALLVFLPYLKSLRPAPVRENMFKVKLGSDQPSHDVNVGKPERTRPTGVEPAAPEKPITPPPEPQIPKTPPKKVTPPPEPQIPKAPPKKTVKPPPKRTTRKTVAPPPEPTVPTASTKPRNHSTGDRRSSTSRQTEEKRRGGNNFNNTVPIGSRNTGQRLGKPDHRTPQGGLTEADEAYNRRLKVVMEDKWIQPPDSLLGGLRPQATIELEISADGRVLSARIIKESGNFSMDESVRRLLKVLDRVPVPPNGALKIHVNLAVK